MQNSRLRFLVPLALFTALAACSDEPEADTSPTAATDTTAATTTPAAAPTQEKAPPPPPVLPAATTGFERALRALTNGSNVRFESETTLADGSSQYATGAGSVLNAKFQLRTLPKASAQFDGNWLLQGGRYLKESGVDYDVSALNPPVVANMFAAIAAIPQNDAALAAGAPKAELVGTVECNARQVDLAKDVRLVSAYKSIEVCIDDTRANLIRLKAELQTGERLTATFAGHGEIVNLPQTQVKDWSQEYPRR